ncbi:unnamed protein product, partial [Musa banksii]
LPFFSPTNSTSSPLFPPAGNRGAACSPASTSSSPSLLFQLQLPSPQPQPLLPLLFFSFP